MIRNILANCEEGEIKVAIIEDGEITELFIERDTEENNVGNIYWATVENIVNSLEAIFLDAGLEKSVYLPFSEIIGVEPSSIKKGDKLMIQVTKSEISTKGARVTTNVSLPGRYLVYQPFEKGIGVSRNISDRDERHRLKSILNEVFEQNQNKSKTGGFIVRTEAEGVEKKYFEQEVKYLLKLWDEISKKSRDSAGVLHKDLTILGKIIREKFTDYVEFFAIDDFQKYKEIYDFVSNVAPDYLAKIVHYEDGRNPFEDYGLDSITERIMKQKIYLKSGGYLVIQEAESLCAIDVNSGSTKGENLETVILKTNLEAVKEIALQLRLRNIGGIIVIDFIDMTKDDHKNEILEALKEATKIDKARIKISPITQMGLIEMTRQRKTESIVTYLSDICPCCKGTGRIYSKESVLLKLRKDLKNFKDTDTKDNKIKIFLNPSFSKFMTKRRVKFLRKDIENKVFEFVYDYKIPPYKYEIIME